MAQATDVLVWMDMEMTGLYPERDRVIEVATVLTDGHLNELAAGPELVISQPEEVLGAMDDWNRRHHGESGLLERVRASTVTEAEAEAAILQFLDAHVSGKDRPVLAGNSIHQDRRFLLRHMPLLEGFLHYRQVDVSSLKVLARAWYGPEAEFRKEQKNHTALDDIQASLAELRYYRATVLRLRTSAPGSAVA
ncbi:MAG: oligoribonuclease [Polyangiaceae bacterium]|nr:oligoribonuclease [Polyangiaceae bacterium]